MFKNHKKRAWEMYSFLIGTIIGLLIIGAMFFGYGIYKSSTSNSQIFTAVQNGDLNKLSSLRLNNLLPINTDKVVVFKKGDNNVDLSALTDTGSAYTYVVSNDPAVNEGVINKSDFFTLDDDKIISKGFITPGVSTDRIPKYFGNPNTTTASGYTIFETSDTSYYGTNNILNTSTWVNTVTYSFWPDITVNNFYLSNTNLLVYLMPRPNDSMWLQNTSDDQWWSFARAFWYVSWDNIWFAWVPDNSVNTITTSVIEQPMSACKWSGDSDWRLLSYADIVNDDGIRTAILNKWNWNKSNFDVWDGLWNNTNNLGWIIKLWATLNTDMVNKVDTTNSIDTFCVKQL